MRATFAGVTTRVRALRHRLVASILVAALVPFGAAFWIASSYLSQQQRRAVDERLAFTLRSAVARYGDVMASTRTSARQLARDPALVRALTRRSVRALEGVLGPRQAVVLPSGLRVGPSFSGVPTARVTVVASGRRLGVVEVGAPGVDGLLERISRRAPLIEGDLLAVARRGVLVSAPSSLRVGASIERAAALAGGHYAHRSVALPGYADGTRLVAFVDRSDADAALARLRRWLALVGGASLVSILLYAAALARPLVRGFDRVADVAQQAEIDPLTGIANRRGFERALAVELERSARHARPCSIVLADLDDFKQVNDLYGHDAGDAALVAFAAQLRESTRSSDVVARLCGEEFALVLPEIDLEGAVVVAERIRRLLAERSVTTAAGDRLSVTASLGVAEASGRTDWLALLKDADQALYAAKRAGKNRVVTAGSGGGRSRVLHASAAGM